MESCKYHPLTPSQFYCQKCQLAYCTDCVDHSVGDEAHCFHCKDFVETRVTADNVEPFWRRLEKAFKYPLNKNALMMVVGISVISVVLTAIPMPGLIRFILNLIIAGASINYAFMCLTATSEGELTPPNFGDAFVDSLDVLWKLFLLVLLAGAVIWALAVYTTSLLAGLAMIIMIVGAPAILMCFATSQSVLESLNPMNFVKVMTSVGLPYFVLLMFLLIMSSSVGVINSFISEDFLALSTIFQSSVSNYYAIVSFHLMGYMLYQYQDRLGFSTPDDEALLQKSEPQEVILNHVNICLKEGEYSKAISLLKNGIGAEPKQKKLYIRLFDLLYRLEDKTELAAFADAYLAFTIRTARSDLTLADFRKIKQLLPNFIPKDPSVRLQIAHAAHAHGDAYLAVQLINGLHKQHPDFDKVIDAYQLMAKALTELPNMAGRAEQCYALIKALEKQYASRDSALENQSAYGIKEPKGVKTSSAPVDNDRTAKQDADAKKTYEPIEFR